MKIIFLDFNGTIDEPFHRRDIYPQYEDGGRTKTEETIERLNEVFGVKPEDGAFGAEEVEGRNTALGYGEQYGYGDGHVTQAELEELRARDLAPEDRIFDADGYDKNGYDIAGFDRDGFDDWGFDKDGFDKEGIDMDGVVKNNAFGEDGFDKYGFDKEGYNRYGFNRDGVDRQDFTPEGYKYYPSLPGVVSQRANKPDANPPKFVQTFSYMKDEPGADSVRLLKELADKTGAKIVFSSTRRYSGVKACINYVGLPEEYFLDHPIHGITPTSLPEEKISPFNWLAKRFSFGKPKPTYQYYKPRQREIKAWLNAWDGEPVENYVILDDDSIDDPDLVKHWVSSVKDNRFQKAEFEEALKILGTK